MANNISSHHPSVIAAEALRHLEDKFSITNMCTRDAGSEFSTRANGWKVGDTVSFRTHGDYEAKEFTGAGPVTVQDISTSKRSMQIEKHYDVSVSVTAREEVLHLDSFSDQVLRPASYRLAEKVEGYVASKLVMGGTAGTPTGPGGGMGMHVSDDLLGTLADVATARKVATLQQLESERFAIVDLDLEAKLLGSQWFSQAAYRGELGVNSTTTGVMGTVMGINWNSSLHFPTNATAHTPGDGTASTNNDSGANNKIGDTTLVCTAVTIGTGFKAGDRIAIAGVRRPLVVKTAAAATATSIVLVDPITEIIPDGAAIVSVGNVAGTPKALTYQGAIFDSRSLAVAFPMLDAPGDRVTGVASNNGVSIRVVKGYDLSTKTTTLSLDLLVGAFCLDPRRITLLANY